MRVRAVGHACLDIETRGIRLLTDPWWSGPAYTRQWYPWPPPSVGRLAEERIDYVYISHGHQDHLHADTLRTLKPGAVALVPKLLGSSGFASWLKSEFRFADVRELPHGVPVELGHALHATCYVNVTDSMLVLDDGETVLVNANDALHAAPRAVQEYFVRLLRQKHGRIGCVFLGFGGASWYPNCIHWPGKDDRREALAREDALVSSFVRLVDGLEPDFAFAFAGSFVLLEPHLTWVVESRFDAESPPAQYARVGRSRRTRCHQLLPGDGLVDGRFTPGDCPKPDVEAFRAALRSGELRAEAARHAQLEPLSPAAIEGLVAKVDRRVRENFARVAPRPFAIELALRDNPGTSITVMVTRDGASADTRLHARTAGRVILRAEILEAWLDEDFGAESIVIGYGAEVFLPRKTHLEHVESLLELLSPRRGSWRGVLDGARKAPSSALLELWRQRTPLALHGASLFGLDRALSSLRKIGPSRDAPPTLTPARPLNADAARPEPEQPKAKAG